jgi:hypothetical protein
VWPAIHTKLITSGLRSVTPEEAQALQGQGWTLVSAAHAVLCGGTCTWPHSFTRGPSFAQVDVRLAGDFEQVWGARGCVPPCACAKRTSPTCSLSTGCF